MSDAYVHGYHPRENERLQDQAGTLVDLLHSGTAYPRGSTVLEAGCGNGNVLRFLTRSLRRGVVIGIDLFEEGLLLARRRSNAHLVRGDIHAPPFRCRFAA